MPYRSVTFLEIDMKRVITALALLAVAGTASAQWHHHGYHGGYRYHGGYSGGGWVAPLIIGGVVGAVIANNRDPIVVQQPPVIVQQPQSVIIQRQPVCTEWREIQNSDGTIYRERTCTQ